MKIECPSCRLSMGYGHDISVWDAAGITSGPTLGLMDDYYPNQITTLVLIIPKFIV